MSKINLFIILALFIIPHDVLSQESKEEIYFRINQVGYLPDDPKVAILFSNHPIPYKDIVIRDSSTASITWKAEKELSDDGPFGNFDHHYRLDFSSLTTRGTYQIVLAEPNIKSLFLILGAMFMPG